jgi:hypothetical protein
MSWSVPTLPVESWDTFFFNGASSGSTLELDSVWFVPMTPLSVALAVSCINTWVHHAYDDILVYQSYYIMVFGLVWQAVECEAKWSGQFLFGPSSNISSLFSSSISFRNTDVNFPLKIVFSYEAFDPLCIYQIISCYSA